MDSPSRSTERSGSAVAVKPQVETAVEASAPSDWEQTPGHLGFHVIAGGTLGFLLGAVISSIDPLVLLALGEPQADAGEWVLLAVRNVRELVPLLTACGMLGAGTLYVLAPNSPGIYRLLSRIAFPAWFVVVFVSLWLVHGQDYTFRESFRYLVLALMVSLPSCVLLGTAAEWLRRRAWKEVRTLVLTVAAGLCVPVAFWMVWYS